MFKTIAGLQVFVPMIEQSMPRATELQRFSLFDAQHAQHLELLEREKQARRAKHTRVDLFPSLREQDLFENYAVLDFRQPEGGLHRAATFGILLALDVQKNPLHALFITHTLRFVNRGGLKSEILPAHPLPASAKQEAA